MLHKHAELLYQGVTEAVGAHLREVGQQVSGLPDAQVRLFAGCAVTVGGVLVGG